MTPAHAELAQLAADAYLPPAEFRARYPDQTVFVLTAESSHRSLIQRFAAWASGGKITTTGAMMEAYAVETADTIDFAIRGTDDFWALVLDLGVWKVIEPEGFEGTGAGIHAGFAAGGQALWPQVKTILDTTRKPSRWRGHSMGGAVAVKLAARASLAGYEVAGIYTIGQPRVGDEAFVALLDGKPYDRSVYQSDIVPRVPLFAMGFAHEGHEYWHGPTRTWRSASGFRKSWRFLWRPHRLVSDHRAKNYLRDPAP